MALSQPDPPKPPPPPPATPTRADASVLDAGRVAASGYSSMISTGSTGLRRRANTVRSSLIGGNR
jgi:hypothetical protein